MAAIDDFQSDEEWICFRPPTVDELAEKDRELAEKDRELAEKDRELAEKDRELAEKDRELAKMKESAKKARKAEMKYRIKVNGLILEKNKRFCAIMKETIFTDPVVRNEMMKLNEPLFKIFMHAARGCSRRPEKW
jgi:hypothetical protein